ncbi:MAG TPA: hypothetical protein VFX98_17335 [Longimicrobiaceae bacterium]|nr:hypothetical protein [Longimicrobiaceae bacterium]
MCKRAAAGLLSVVILAAACSTHRGNDTDAPPDLPLPAYPGAVHLGQQRVYGTDGTHITWDGFASADPPARVVDFYRGAVARVFEASAERFEAGEGGGGKWRFLRPGEGDVVLDVMPAGRPGPHEAFAERIPASARTIVILSRRP